VSTYTGLIDDIQVYDHALSDLEVQWLFEHPGRAVVCVPAPAGMVSQWKAEGNASDFIGSNNGTLVNGTLFASGMVGQAFSFDGVDGYVDVPALTTLNFPAAFTIGGWVKANSLPGDIAVLAGMPGSYQMDIRNNGVVTFGNSGLMVDSDSALGTGDFYHVAATFESGSVNIYINGVLDKTGTTTTYSGEERSFQIGGFGAHGSYFNGLIDDLVVYNRALIPSEISAVYEAGPGGICGQFDAIPGLRLWLKADSGLIPGGADSVATWEDRSGNGLDVAQTTEANRPTRVAAALNGVPVVHFDGGNDYLIRGSVPGYDLFDNNTDTVFIVQKQTGADPRTSTFSWTSDGTNRFMVHATWENLISYQVGAASGGGILETSQPYGWDDQWHVLKLIRDGNDGQINVDGIDLTPTTTFSSPGNNSPAADLYVGSDYWTVNNLYSSTNWFTGDIAEILVFNRALTSQEQQTVDTYLRGKYGLTSTPDAFAIPEKVDQPLNGLIESAAITVSGITLLAPISISDGGEYAINGGSYTADPGIVVNGDSITVRQTSSAGFSTKTDVILTIGGVSGTFSVTTEAADTIPDTFSFPDKTNVPVNSHVESDVITVTGINSGTPITITGGEYSLNDSAYVDTQGASINGDTVKVRLMSSGTFSTTTTAVLTIGGVSGSFTVTTEAEDTTPDAFVFKDQTGVNLNTVLESNLITVQGINTAAPIAITGGLYTINGGPVYTDIAGTVVAGDTVRVRQTSSAGFSTTTEAVLFIGGVSGTFSVTTLASNSLFLPIIIK
jgi:hypothetical protein